MCQGTIRQDCGDGSYLVEDSVSDLEQINRADIITDADDAANQIGLHDPVIAPHPSFPYAYAPGTERRSANLPYTFLFWTACLPMGFQYIRMLKKEIFDTTGESKSPFPRSPFTPKPQGNPCALQAYLYRELLFSFGESLLLSLFTLCWKLDKERV